MFLQRCKGGVEVKTASCLVWDLMFLQRCKRDSRLCAGLESVGFGYLYPSSLLLTFYVICVILNKEYKTEGHYKF